jgi:hypothetical protein
MQLPRHLGVIVITGAIACDGTTSPAPCNGDIEVVAVTTTPVRFAWTPACGVSTLLVTTESALPEGSVAWGISVSEQEPIGPDVVYGVKPRGATEWKAAVELEPGREYRVIVRHTVGGDVIVAQGQRDFTWFPPD